MALVRFVRGMVGNGFWGDLGDILGSDEVLSGAVGVEAFGSVPVLLSVRFPDRNNSALSSSAVCWDCSAEAASQKTSSSISGANGGSSPSLLWSGSESTMGSSCEGWMKDDPP